MDLNDLSAASLDQMEQQLLADLEIVRGMKELIARRRSPSAPAVPPASPAPASPPLAVAPPPVVADAPAPYVPPPLHPNWHVKDVALAVRQIVGTLSGTFGIGDVKQQLDQQHYQTFGDSTIRGVLQDMQAVGELVLASRGFGRAGNKYSKPAPAPSPDSPPG